MSEDITWLGLACIALALLCALAGAGWWRLAVQKSDGDWPTHRPELLEALKHLEPRQP